MSRRLRMIASICESSASALTALVSKMSRFFPSLTGLLQHRSPSTDQAFEPLSPLRHSMMHRCSARLPSPMDFRIDEQPRPSYRALAAAYPRSEERRVG